MGWTSPILGAPDGKVRRRCQHEGEFRLVRRFSGIETWQCMTCRKVSEVETRPEGDKTCLHCGKPLVGRQSRWCSEDHGYEYAFHKSREEWTLGVKRRDGFTCRRCGWKPNRSASIGWRVALEMERAGVEFAEGPPDPDGRVQLEAHHVHPIEYGGDEFDPENGITLCNLCHDEEHRQLGERGMPVGGKRRAS